MSREMANKQMNKSNKELHKKLQMEKSGTKNNKWTNLIKSDSKIAQRNKYDTKKYHKK